MLVRTLRSTPRRALGTLLTLPAAGGVAAGEARTCTFAVTLAAGATNADQGKAASAAVRWDAAQAQAPAPIKSEPSPADLLTRTPAP